MRQRRETQPRDYFSQETGSWKKKWKDRLPVALIFPNDYRVGMSNLGFQTVYHLLNQQDQIVCERIFLPAAGQPLSIESSRPLRDFPVILISSSFEEDFLHTVEMLKAAELEIFAADRGDGRIAAGDNPLIVAGGVATFINPEPLAPFVDLFVIGEAEEILPAILAIILGWGEAEKVELLYRLAAEHPGCYAPRFYQPNYNENGRLKGVDVEKGLPARISKVTVKDLAVAGHSQIMTPAAEFSDLYLTELGRGCSRGCRFCAAGFVYRPPRLWSAEAILSALAERPATTKRVGLLGMEMARPAALEQVSATLLQEGCSLSFSSLRADAMTNTLVDLLEKSDLKSAAIAPDGASERLRRVINKGIVEDEILQAAEVLVGAGITNLKLYFMIGLPTETMEDLDEMVLLVKKIKERIMPLGRKRGRLSNITLSVNSFVPKAWTPFQFHAFTDPAELSRRVKYIKTAFNKEPNVKVVVDQPGKAFFQAMLARGDRRTGMALGELAGSNRNWLQVFKGSGVRPEDYVLRNRPEDELFAWDIIDHSIKRSYLWTEYQRALAGKVTPACDTAKCKRCGVCNGS